MVTPDRLKIVMVPPQYGMSNHCSGVTPAWFPSEPELMDEIAGSGDLPSTWHPRVGGKLYGVSARKPSLDELDRK